MPTALIQGLRADLTTVIDTHKSRRTALLRRVQRSIRTVFPGRLVSGGRADAGEDTQGFVGFHQQLIER